MSSNQMEKWQTSSLHIITDNSARAYSHKRSPNKLTRFSAELYVNVMQPQTIWALM